MNCERHDVPVIAAAKIIKPIGDPVGNATKHYLTQEIIELSRNRAFLTRMENAIHQYWRGKNARKKRNTQDTNNGNGES